MKCDNCDGTGWVFFFDAREWFSPEESIGDSEHSSFHLWWLDGEKDTDLPKLVMVCEWCDGFGKEGIKSRPKWWQKILRALKYYKFRWWLGSGKNYQDFDYGYEPDWDD